MRPFTFAIMLLTPIAASSAEPHYKVADAYPLTEPVICCPPDYADFDTAGRTANFFDDTYWLRDIESNVVLTGTVPGHDRILGIAIGNANDLYIIASDDYDDHTVSADAAYSDDTGLYIQRLDIDTGAEISSSWLPLNGVVSDAVRISIAADDSLYIAANRDATVTTTVVRFDQSLKTANAYSTSVGLGVRSLLADPSNVDHVWLAGWTEDTSFPATDGSVIVDAGQQHGYLLQLEIPLDASAPAVTFATLIGDSAPNIAVLDLAIAGSDIYFVGSSQNGNLPVTPDAYQNEFRGERDGFIGKMTIAGGVSYLSYFGGSSYDDISHIAIDSDNNIVFGGQGYSWDLPVTDGAFLALPASEGLDAYIGVFDANLTTVRYLTYIGGTTTWPAGYDPVTLLNDLEITSNNRLMTAFSSSTQDFPVRPGVPVYDLAYQPLRLVRFERTGLWLDDNDIIPYVVYVGTPYEYHLAALGGEAPYSFEKGTGWLASGLELTPEGVISGTATTLGGHDGYSNGMWLTFAVEDSMGERALDMKYLHAVPALAAEWLRDFEDWSVHYSGTLIHAELHVYGGYGQHSVELLEAPDGFELTETDSTGIYRIEGTAPSPGNYPVRVGIHDELGYPLEISSSIGTVAAEPVTQENSGGGGPLSLWLIALLLAVHPFVQRNDSAANSHE